MTVKAGLLSNYSLKIRAIFYLLNVGFALLMLEIYVEVESSQKTIEVLSKKIGGFSIYLGFMLFVNLYLFFRGRKASKAP